MTPAEMDEVVATARTALAKGALTLSTEFAGRLARALLAAVGERDALVEARAVDERLRRTAIDNLSRWAAENADTATARAVAAEQRAERAEAAVAALTTGAQRVLTDERARVVEAIAAWHDKAALIDGGHGNRGQQYAHALSADHIRSHNWAAPEEES